MSRRREPEMPPSRRQRRRIDLFQEESQALAEALQSIEDANLAEALQADEDSQALAEALQADEDSQALAEALQADEDSQTKLECNICYDDIESDGKGCPSQNCFAVFHEQCVARWRSQGKDTCAMCQV